MKNKKKKSSHDYRIRGVIKKHPDGVNNIYMKNKKKRSETPIVLFDTVTSNKH